ncbi:hypothetical protein PHLCEN_2v13117 [Hermanssonia centrifuga]|uniref:Uncharacterized protein n=1 Tax=Hermanssonia centrifuga TaxID=98765 RepID=A0A2R6NF68_9APHY|nr:hypothetical protein PHLCEN_2v13117 [Hermanssonia centrifuga]
MSYLTSSNNAAFTPDPPSTSLPARISATAHQQSIFINPFASFNGPSAQTQVPPSRHVEEATQSELQEESDLMPMDLPPAYQRD